MSFQATIIEEWLSKDGDFDLVFFLSEMKALSPPRNARA